MVNIYVYNGAKIMIEHAMEILKCRDPLYFCENYSKVTTLDQVGPQPFELTRFAKKAITSIDNSQFTVAIGDRQTGKTTTAIEYALWYSLMTPSSTVVLCGHSYRSSWDLLGKFRSSLEELPSWMRPRCLKNNKERLSLDNGSDIICASTPIHLHGRSVSLLVVDEAAYCSNFKESISDWWPSIGIGKVLMVTSINLQNYDFNQFLRNRPIDFDLVVG